MFDPWNLWYLLIAFPLGALWGGYEGREWLKWRMIERARELAKRDKDWAGYCPR